MSLLIGLSSAVVALAAVAALGVSVVAQTPAATKPNIVLVHGAWADGSSWGAVIERLQQAGYSVVAVQLPLSSLADDVARTRQVLRTQVGPTVVVGHSYGGIVIGELGEDAPNVVALAYIAAFAFDEGDSVQKLLAKGGPPSLASLHPDKQGYLWFDPLGFTTFFAPDVAPAQARVMAATQKPIAAANFGTPSGPPAWKRLPPWYLVAENDQIIPPDAQRAMAKQIRATTSAATGSHALIVSQPGPVTDFIVRAAGGR